MRPFFGSIFLFAPMLLATVPAAAGEFYLFSSPAACERWLGMGGTQDALSQVSTEDDTLILQSSSMSGLEYGCLFEPPLDLSVQEPTITTHVGHCQEPGWISPGLFTFAVDPVYSREVTLYTGDESTTVFHFCGR